MNDQPFLFTFSNYDGYLKPSYFGKGKERTILPVTPSSFDLTTKNNAFTVTALSGRTFSHAGPEDLLSVSFESFFPAGFSDTRREDLPSWMNPYDACRFEPGELIQMFQEAQSANQPIKFTIVQSGSPGGRAGNAGSSVILAPTSVTIQSFTPSYNFGDGHDVKYSMSVQQWNPQDADTMNSPASTKGYYVTKQGDRYNCTGIALTQLRDRSRYVEIVRINKAVLEKDHAKRIKLSKQNSKIDAKFITPGTKLLLPAPVRAVGATPDNGAPIR